MSFGISKCATLVIKPLNFKKPKDYEEPTFYMGMSSLPKTSCYTYLGIPFSDDLSLKPILSNMYIKVNNALHLFKSFLLNRTIPIGFKVLVVKSFIISKALYYAPLLGSNKKRTSRIQSLLHKAILWTIGSYSKTENGNSKCHARNPYLSIYALSRDLNIPPLAGICAAQQVKCFVKWRSSNCIIKDLVKDIPHMSHNSWSKESHLLRNKLNKINKRTTKEIKEHYWIKSPTNKGIKALRYKNSKFADTKQLFRFSYDKPQVNLGINWILRIRANFENSTRIALASNRVTPDCPRCCPCCNKGKQSFLHWILECEKFLDLRIKYLNFIEDLYYTFLSYYRKKYVYYFLSEEEVKRSIYNFIYSFLLGGTLAFNELHIDSGERRRLNGLLYNTSESSVPYMFRLAEYLTNTIPIISSSMELLFGRFSKTSIVIKSVDVVLIRHRNNSIPYTGSDIDLLN